MARMCVPTHFRDTAHPPGVGDGGASGARVRLSQCRPLQAAAVLRCESALASVTTGAIRLGRVKGREREREGGTARENKASGTSPPTAPLPSHPAPHAPTRLLWETVWPNKHGLEGTTTALGRGSAGGGAWERTTSRRRGSNAGRWSGRDQRAKTSGRTDGRWWRKAEEKEAGEKKKAQLAMPPARPPRASMGGLPSVHERPTQRPWAGMRNRPCCHGGLANQLSWQAWLGEAPGFSSAGCANHANTA